MSEGITRRGFMGAVAAGMAFFPGLRKMVEAAASDERERMIEAKAIDVTHAGTPPGMWQYLVEDGVVAMRASGPIKPHQLLTIDKRGMAVPMTKRWDRSHIIGTAISSPVGGKCRVRIGPRNV